MSMKKLALLIFALTTVNAIAEEPNCDGLVPLDKVNEICGIEFIKDEVTARNSRCKANYIDKSKGKKYVGEVGISSELIIKVNHRLSKKGKNNAPVSFQSSIDGARQRETFRKEVSGLGEGAFYSELDIHQTVTWYEGEYLYNFTVDKGQLNGEGWIAPCTPEQTIEVAKAIGSQSLPSP
jgi:hypothetical protein